MLTAIVLILLHISIVLGADRRNLLSPLNALLLLIWIMVLRASELVIFGESIYPDWVKPYMNEFVILDTSLVIGLFVVCFFLSYLLFDFVIPDEKRYVYSNSEIKISRGVILGMAAVGTICALRFFSNLDDVTDIILNKTKPELFEGSGPLIAGISFLPAAIIGVLLSCRSKRLLAGIFAVLLLITGAVYLPLGQRGNVFTFVILAFVICVAKLRKLSPKLAISTGIALLLCLELAVIWRTTLRYGYDGELLDFVVVAQSLDGIDRGEFDGLAGLVAYNASIGFDSWWSFTEQLIPRALLPSKKEYVAVSYLVNLETIGYADAGFTASIIGTAFAQGGLGGVAIFGTIFGFSMQILQRWFVYRPCTTNGLLLRGLALAFVFFLARNGDLTNVLIMLLVNAAGVLFLMAAYIVLPIWRRTWIGLRRVDSLFVSARSNFGD
jgi:hypothetical protein